MKPVARKTILISTLIAGFGLGQVHAASTHQTLEPSTGSTVEAGATTLQLAAIFRPDQRDGLEETQSQINDFGSDDIPVQEEVEQLEMDQQDQLERLKELEQEQ